MTTDLNSGKELPISFSAGMIIAFKSAKLDLTPVPRVSVDEWVPVIHKTDLDLCNIDHDIILRITFFRGSKRVFFNDRANESLSDGWGQEKSVELSQEDLDRWQRSGVTISVHDCSIPSKEQYRILFDSTTIHYIDKHFPGPATKVTYSAEQLLYTSITGRPSRGILSDPLKIFTYNLDDLLLVDKQAVESRG